MNHSKTLVSWGIIIAVCAAYANALHGPFVFDDYMRILYNPAIRDLSKLSAFWDEFPTRCIAMFSFGINYHFGGYNTFGYHLVNVVIHALNSVLVFSLVFRLLAPSHRSIQIAGFAALFFALRPVQTQTVNYIVQRMTSLCVLFYLLAMWCFTKQRDAEGKISIFWGVGALCGAVAAMFTKPIAATLPGAVIMMEFFLLRSDGSRIGKLVRIVPWLLIATIPPVMLILERNAEFYSPLASMSYAYEYWHTQVIVFLDYLRLIAWPLNLSLDYDFPVFHPFGFKTIAGVLAVGILLALSVFSFKKFRLVAFGILFFLMAMSVEAFVPLADVFFEHRLYLPMFGVALALAGLADALAKANPSQFVRNGMWCAGACVLAIGAFLTIQQNEIWSSKAKVWGNAVATAPNKFRARLNFAEGLYVEGRYAEAQQQLWIAKRLSADPQWQFRVNQNLAINERLLGRLDSAKQLLWKNEMGLQIPVRNFVYLAHFSLEDDPDLARALIERAQRLAGQDPRYHYVASEMSYRDGDFEGGLKHASASLKIESHSNLARLAYAKNLHGLKRYRESEAMLGVVAKDVNLVPAEAYELAKTYLMVGERNEAKQTLAGLREQNKELVIAQVLHDSYGL